MQATPPLPLPGVSRATALDLVTGLSQMYANLQIQIAQHIAAELAKGITLPTWADKKLKAAGDMHRWTRTLLDRIGKDSSEEVSKTILEAYARGGDAAMRALAAHGMHPADPGPKIRAALASHGKTLDRKLSEIGQAFPGVAAMQRVAGALHLRINGTHMPILRWTDDAYRQVVAKAGLTDVLAGTQTQRQTAQKVWEQLVGDGITGFTDKAGKRWNLASYVDMAVRTGVAHAAVEGHLDRLAGAGIDLVIVSNAPQECPLCRKWEGKILSRVPASTFTSRPAPSPTIQAKPIPAPAPMPAPVPVPVKKAKKASPPTKTPSEQPATTPTPIFAGPHTGENLLAAKTLDTTELAQKIQETKLKKAAGGYGGHGPDNALYGIAHAQGFTGVPHVVTRAEIDAHIAAGATELFRMVGDFGGTTAAAFAEQFRTGAYYAGHGLHGSGIYTAASSAGITNYGPPSGLIRMALRHGARVATIDDLNMASQLQAHRDGTKWTAAEKLVYSDPGRLAAALGYDAISLLNKSTIVLNRTALWVEERQ